MEYVTYDYYKEAYQGGASETEFDKYNFDAQLEYENYTLKPKLTDKLLDENKKGAIAIRTSICKMIDNLIEHEQLLANAKQTDIIASKGIASESVKDHSVSFVKSENSTVDIINSQLEVSNRKIMNKYLLMFGLLERGL